MLSMATVAATYMMTTMMFVAGVQAMTLPPTIPLLREKQLSNRERVRAETGEQTGYVQKSPENLLMADHYRRVSNPIIIQSA